MQRFQDRREAASYLTERGLKITFSTLQKMATLGGGPRYAIFGNRAIYAPEDLDDWVTGRLKTPRSSTSEST